MTRLRAVERTDVAAAPADHETAEMDDLPRLRQTVLDTTDARGLAEYYRRLLGLRYRPGDEPPADATTDDADWLVLWTPEGAAALAFQQTDGIRATTWPDASVPMQLHIDMTVPDLPTLHRSRDRAVELGGRVLLDRSGDDEEPLYVIADPAGHPFCLFVG